MTSEQVVTRGEELYEGGIRAQTEAGNQGKYLAIDVETGEYLMAATHEEFVKSLFLLPRKRERYLMRIGSPVYVYRGSARFKNNG